MARLKWPLAFLNWPHVRVKSASFPSFVLMDAAALGNASHVLLAAVFLPEGTLPAVVRLLCRKVLKIYWAFM